LPLALFPKCFIPELCAGEMAVNDWIDLASELDADGLEFYWPFTPANPGQRREIAARVAAQKRSIPMMCYSPDFTHPEREARQMEVRKQKEVLLACGDLGTRYCRVLSGQRRPGLDREEAISWVADSIHQLLPAAERLGIVLILENHYKDTFWEFPEFAQHADVFVDLLNRIGKHPNFGVNFDPSNTLIAGEDPIELLEIIKRDVVTMHASDRYLEGGTLADLQRLDIDPATGYNNLLKHGVVGRGLNDYDRIFSILSSSGSAGWISIEDGTDPKSGMEHLALSAAFLRKKMSQYGLR
jgi:sugar phosphate isomerase/epimerase